MGFFYNKSGSSSGSSNKELEKLLKIASDSNLEVPKEKVTALERFMGMMRASETSGIAADIQSGEGLGDALKTYGSRLAKGWTGQGLTEEDLSGVEGYKEVLAKEGVSEKPWFELGPIKPSTAGVAGLALDIGLDPLTYVGSGLTKAGKGAAKTAGRESLEELASRGGKEAIESIAGKTTRNFAGETSEIAGKRIGAKLGGTSAEQAKLGQKSVANFMGQPLLPKGVNETIYKSRDAILRKFGETNAGKTVDLVSKLFNTEYIPLAIKGTAKEADKRALYLAGKVSKNLDEGVKRFGKETSDSLFKQVKDKSGKDVDEAISMMGDVMNAVERTPMGGEMVKVSDDIAPMVKEALDFRDKIHKIYTEYGGKDLADEEIGYWLHALDPTDTSKLAKSMGFSAREFTDKVKSDYVRNFGKALDEKGVWHTGDLRKLRKQFDVVKEQNATIKEINKSLGFNKFSEDIMYTTYLMSARVGKKAGGTQYLDLASGLGKAGANAPEGWIKSTSPFFKGQDVVFSPDVAKQIDNTYKAYFSDEALNDVITMYDKVQGVFKASVTSVWPAFHARNAVSNVWQNYLAGVKNPLVYTKATKMMSDVRSGGIESLSKADRKVYQSFLDNGLSGFGYFGGDVASDATKKFGKTAIKDVPGKAYKGANKLGMDVGSEIETMGKLAHFIDKTNKGFSSIDAAQSVKKYLFDYSDLTDFEKNIMKRVAPFYTFTRKNLPMELNALVESPGKFSTLTKTMRSAGYTPGEKGVPSYLREQPSYDIGDGKRVSGGIFGLPALEPLEMLGETPGRTMEKTLSKLLSPLIKVPLETALDRSMFRGKPLSEVKSVEAIWGKQIVDTGMQEAFGLTENTSKEGTTYYTTTKPVLWNNLRSLFSRYASTATGVSKMSEKDLNTAYIIANLTMGIKADVKGEDMKGMSDREVEKRLFEFLKSKNKAYKFELYGAVE